MAHIFSVGAPQNLDKSAAFFFQPQTLGAETHLKPGSIFGAQREGDGGASTHFLAVF